MKKLIVLLLLVLGLMSVGHAYQVGISITKSVNSGWEVAIPINISTETEKPRIYLLTKAVFTAPRGNLLMALFGLNHSRFEMVLGGGTKIGSISGDFETGANYWWAQNNEGKPEGLDWKNALHVYAGKRYF